MTMTVLDRAPVTGAPGQVADADQGRPDPEVPERARRRTFTAKYKLDVLAAYDAAEPGEKGAVLRRKGLYSSHIVEWRRARDVGALAGLTAPRGRRRPDTRDALAGARHPGGVRRGGPDASQPLPAAPDESSPRAAGAGPAHRASPAAGAIPIPLSSPGCAAL